MVDNPAFDDARSHSVSFRALGFDDDELDEDSEHGSDPEEDQATPTLEKTPDLAPSQMARSPDETEDGKSISRKPSVIGMDDPVPHTAEHGKW